MLVNKFCTECGAELSEEDNFCTSCGNAVDREETPPLPKDEKKEPKKVKEKAEEKVKEISLKQVISAADKLIGNTALASPSNDEMVFEQAFSTAKEIQLPQTGPIKYLFGGAARIFKGFKEVRKDKKRLIPVIIMTVTWVVLSLFPILGIQSSTVRVLNFLTFARGGANAGVSGIIGGTIGKGLIACFITGMVIPLFSGKKPFKGIGRGFKKLFGAFNVKDRKAFAKVLLGTGLALIAYNFLTGNATLQNSMAGIAAFLMSLKALSRKAGFLRGFIMSIMNKSSKGTEARNLALNSIMSGLTAGFGISVMLSAVNISFICYAAGIALFAAAIIFSFTSGKEKGVA